MLILVLEKCDLLPENASFKIREFGRICDIDLLPNFRYGLK